MRLFVGLVLALALGVMGCGDGEPETCPVLGATCQYNGDRLVKCDSDQYCDQAAGFVCLLDSGEPATDGAVGLCSKPLGNGGTSNELAVLSSCSGDGLRGFIGFLDGLGDLLRYVDGTSALPGYITYDEGLREFAWQIDVDGTGGTETVVRGELIESSGTLARGIEFGEVIHADWTWAADPASTGEGKLSIYGLNNETIRVTPLVEPRYDDGGACHVQFTVVYFHLDLSDSESERTAAQLGFWVEAAPYLLDNAFATFGETLITIDGQYLGEPVTFTLDAETYEFVP